MGVVIANRQIGDDSPTFIVAELSANHCQNFDVAKRTLLAMKKAGADAVKTQVYRPESLTIDCENEYFMRRRDGLWKGMTLYELYTKAQTPREWQSELKKIAEDVGLVFFSSPFDLEGVDFLENIGTAAYKIASFEITDAHLVKYIARKGKPVIISTGVACRSDIENAINICKQAGNSDIIILKCTSSYPTPFEDANLRAMIEIRDVFDVEVGLSDHTMGSDVAIAATALGAKLIEKHFILDRKLDSPDAAFSMVPDEFKSMVDSIRNVEKALGKKTFELTTRQKEARKLLRTLFATRDIKSGEMLTSDNVRSVRSNHGLNTSHYEYILGKNAVVDIVKGTPLSWDLVSNGNK